MSTLPISDKIIQTALSNLAATPDFSEKLAWWLLRAHSAERWLQFELAYQLDRYLREVGGPSESTDRFYVLCEQQRRDISIVRSKVRPIENNASAFSIELKWLGNWYVVGNTFADIKRDVAKVDAFDEPGMSLVVWLLASPKPGERDYAWLQSQVDGGMGIKASGEAIKEKMQKNFNDRFRLLCEVPCKSTEKVENLTLIAYVCQNNK